MDRTQRTAMERTLGDELSAAESRQTVATERFHRLLNEIPSGTSRPDGVQLMFVAGEEATASLVAYGRALNRYTDFRVHGIVPSDLDLPRG
jgi:hypothetical protein